MIVNQQNLQLLNVSYTAAFKSGFKEAPMDYKPLTLEVASQTKENYYPWLGQLPSLREWVGERVIRAIKQYDYRIKNKKWEEVIEVPRDDIEDDQYGVYSPLFSRLGDAAGRHPNELVFNLLKAGGTELGYDGVSYFNGSHPHDTLGTVSNQDTGGAGNYWYLMDLSGPVKPLILQRRREYSLKAKTDLMAENVFWRDSFIWGVDARLNVGFGFWQQAFRSNQTLNAANFEAAYAAMMGFTSDMGVPMGIRPTHLVVGPSNRAAAMTVIKAERNANGATNINQNSVEILVTPWLP